MSPTSLEQLFVKIDVAGVPRAAVKVRAALHELGIDAKIDDFDAATQAVVVFVRASKWYERSDTTICEVLRAAGLSGSFRAERVVHQRAVDPTPS